MRLLLTINAFLATAHGLGFILLPSQMLAFYQIAGGSGAEFMGQLFGAELLVVAIVTWKARDFVSLGALAAVVLANLVADAVGTVLSVRAVMAGTVGAFGWLAVAIYGLLALAYLAVYLKKNYAATAA
ncbi:MAG: hypothetical protein JNM79_12270 [Burkholderiales bacterium]|nr:hypothetical protein [Burkholderiales bacterium]